MSSIPLEMTDADRPAPEQGWSLAPALTIEGALWLLMGLAALLLRLVDLGRWPLAEDEARLAYEAWRFVSGQPYELAGAGSPLAFNLQSLFFALFGASDVTARLPQALAGLGLLLAAWRLRPLLGRGHALGTALLLLLSPSVLFFSRHASGELWGALWALLLVGAVARWARDGAQAGREGLLAALALGLGLASSGGFWSLLLAGALFWLLRNRVGAPRDEESVPVEPAALLRRYGLVALVAFAAGSTALFTNLQGLGAALALPWQWLGALLGGGPAMILPFLFVLMLYEMLALVAGIAGATLIAERGSRWSLFGLLWLAVTVIPASLTNSGWNGALLWATLPLALLGGAALARLGRALAAEGRWRVEGLALALALVLLLFAHIILLRYLGVDSGTTRDLLVLFLLPLAVAIVAYVSVLFVLDQSFGRPAAQRSLALALFVILAVISGSSAWGLSLSRGADPREPIVTRPSDPDLRAAAAELAQLSIERYRDPRAMPVAIQRSLGVAPRWYLREFRSLSLVEGGHGALPEVALLEPDAPPPPGAIGQQLWIGPSWQWPALSRAGALRWLTARDEHGGIVDRAAILHVTLPQE